MNEFDKILDECVDRINWGERLEDCLASYPKHAKGLEPLLRAMLDTQAAYTFTPSLEAKTAARQRFNASLKELQQKQRERQPLFRNLLGWSRVLVPITVVAVVALAGYFGLRPILFPENTQPETATTPAPPSAVPTIPQPSPQGNFAFLISDEENAIRDFESLNVTISGIGLKLEGETGHWIEFAPD